MLLQTCPSLVRYIRMRCEVLRLICVTELKQRQQTWLHTHTIYLHACIHILTTMNFAVFWEFAAVARDCVENDFCYTFTSHIRAWPTDLRLIKM